MHDYPKFETVRLLQRTFFREFFEILGHKLSESFVADLHLNHEKECFCSPSSCFFSATSKSFTVTIHIIHKLHGGLLILGAVALL